MIWVWAVCWLITVACAGGIGWQLAGARTDDMCAIAAVIARAGEAERWSYEIAKLQETADAALAQINRDPRTGRFQRGGA